jgi:hypothetical protein
MKSSKSKTMSKRMRRALEKQVQEYVGNYYPEWGEISVAVNPTGTAASVRCSKAKGPPMTKSGSPRSRK